MEASKRYKESVELHHEPRSKNLSILGYHRIRATLRMRNMDPNPYDGEVAQWLLHADDPSSAQCILGGPHNQCRPLW